MTTILSKEEVERIKQSAINAGLESPQPGSHTLAEERKTLDDAGRTLAEKIWASQIALPPAVSPAEVAEEGQLRGGDIKAGDVVRRPNGEIIGTALSDARQKGSEWVVEVAPGTLVEDARVPNLLDPEPTDPCADPCAPVEIAEVPEEAGRKPASPDVYPGPGELMYDRHLHWINHIAPEEERRLTSLTMARVRAVPFCDECQRPRVAKLNLDTCRIEWVCEEAI
jgi:hypothetical protein